MPRYMKKDSEKKLTKRLSKHGLINVLTQNFLFFWNDLLPFFCRQPLIPASVSGGNVTRIRKTKTKQSALVSISRENNILFLDGVTESDAMAFSF